MAHGEAHWQVDPVVEPLKLVASLGELYDEVPVGKVFIEWSEMGDMEGNGFVVKC